MAYTKKKDIWISLAIIGAAVLTLCFFTLVKGSVKIDAGGAFAELHLNSIFFTTTTVTSGTDPYPVSGRVYIPERLSISMKQDGQTWKIVSRGPWGDLSRIKVKNNRTTALRLGHPFLIKPRVSRSSSSVSVDFAIIGQAGEQYQNFARRNNKLIRQAKVKIIDESGNVLADGRFEYG
jgi:hypothetical protein